MSTFGDLINQNANKNAISNNQATAKNIWGNTLIYQNINSLVADTAIFTRYAGSIINANYAGLPNIDAAVFSNTAGVNGHIINVPPGYSCLWERKLGDRNNISELDKFNGTTFVTISRRQAYNPIARHGLIFPDGIGAGVMPHTPIHSVWTMHILPDSNGGIYMLRSTNNTPSPVIYSATADGKYITGFALTQNPFGIAQAKAIEMHWRSQGNVTPLSNGAVWGNQPAYESFATDSSVVRWTLQNNTADFSLPQVPNGKDKIMYLALLQDSLYTSPVDIIINNISLKSLYSNTYGSEKSLLAVDLSGHHINQIYYSYSNLRIVGYRVPAWVMGNNVYSHCRISTVIGASTVTYYSDCGTIDAF